MIEGEKAKRSEDVEGEHTGLCRYNPWMVQCCCCHGNQKGGGKEEKGRGNRERRRENDYGPAEEGNKREAEKKQICLRAIINIQYLWLASGLQMNGHSCTFDDSQLT